MNLNGISLYFIIAILCRVNSGVDDGIKIGAFNIQVFGTTKAGKVDVMKTLVQVVRRYDILLIQEIRDKTGKAIEDLFQLTNRNQSTDLIFSKIVSTRLGRTISKEQYAIFYREAAGIQLTRSYVYSDTYDLFEREPFVTIFTYKSFEFAMVGIHVDPDTVVSELNALDDVVDDVRSRHHMANVMILGDLNADCRYMPESKYVDISLRSKVDKYNWLIGDGVDTTIKNTHCAYDRFIVSGPRWATVIPPDSIQVYRFDTQLGLDQDQAAKVSDHFPIELNLQVRTRTERYPGVYVYLTDTTVGLDKTKLYKLVPASNRLQTDVFDDTINVGTIRNEGINLLLFDLTRELVGVTMTARPVRNRYNGRQKVDIFITLPV